MDIFDLTKKFTEINEWKTFCQAQSTTILKLTKDLQELKEKNLHLENLIKTSTSLVEIDSKPILNLLGLSDEEAIAINELAKLKFLSLERELSDQECKRFEIYTKTLLALKNNKEKNSKGNAENLPEDELLSIVKS